MMFSSILWCHSFPNCTEPLLDYAVVTVELDLHGVASAGDGIRLRSSTIFLRKCPIGNLEHFFKIATRSLQNKQLPPGHNHSYKRYGPQHRKNWKLIVSLSLQEQKDPISKRLYNMWYVINRFAELLICTWFLLDG